MSIPQKLRRKPRCLGTQTQQAASSSLCGGPDIELSSWTIPACAFRSSGYFMNSTKDQKAVSHLREDYDTERKAASEGTGPSSLMSKREPLFIANCY